MLAKDIAMGSGLESRFEKYTEVLVKSLGHASRAQPASWYLRGLMLPGERKSVEPMAARVHPRDVPSAHQRMHHLVADSEWSDRALLSAVAGEVAPVLARGGPCYWIIDDTGMRKYGRHSVGVARQYCGPLGKTENCQVAVSLSLATPEGSLPLGWRLYLPREWTEDAQRCRAAGVPKTVGFAPKGALAWAQIEAALAADIPKGIVLTDAGYGDEAAFRDQLDAKGLCYAVGIRENTKVWWGLHQPAPVPVHTRGRPRSRVKRDAAHQPISVLELARALPASSYRTMTWREGTKGRLGSRFARVRCAPAQYNRARDEQWLVIEWPAGEPQPTHYFLSNLPADTPFRTLVNTLKMRWRIEHDYRELKEEVGLDHYEGRNWRGFHHHASLCIAAYGFLMLERLSGVKKNTARLQAPALPTSFLPRGTRPDAAARALVDRNRAPKARPRHRPQSVNMSVLL
jgi:SRSO17 transposase